MRFEALPLDGARTVVHVSYELSSLSELILFRWHQVNMPVSIQAILVAIKINKSSPGTTIILLLI
jgi:hypothetical protein